jgi:hypothetical protein
MAVAAANATMPAPRTSDIPGDKAAADHADARWAPPVHNKAIHAVELKLDELKVHKIGTALEQQGE